MIATPSEQCLILNLRTDMTEVQNQMAQLVQGQGAPTMEDLKAFGKLKKRQDAQHKLYAGLLLACLTREVQKS